MDQTITSSIDWLLEISSVKRLMKYQFIRKRIVSFDSFVQRLINRKSQNTTSPTKRRLTILNWILINAVVFAYFAGKADAHNINEMTVVYENYKLFGLSILFVNLIALFIKGIGFIFKQAIKYIINIAAFLFALFVAYLIVKKIYEFFTAEKSSKQITDRIQSQ